MIKYSNGERLETREEIEEELGHHFQDIMTKPILDRSGDIEQITQHIPALVSQAENDLLMKKQWTKWRMEKHWVLMAS